MQNPDQVQGIENKNNLSPEEEADLAAIDALLREENPDFANELDELQKDQIENIVTEFDAESSKVKLKERVKIYLFKIKTLTKNKLVNSYYLSKKNIISFSKNFSMSLIHFFKITKNGLNKLTWKQKIIFTFLFLLSLSLPWITQKALNSFLKNTQNNFVTNLEMFSTTSHKLAKEDKWENYYFSSRIPPHLLLLERQVINLKKEPLSRDNSPPMVAVEFLIEALNPHVLKEIKDKEGFFKNLIREFSENWTFTELESAEGKTRYQSELIQELQKFLKQGQLSKIYLKTIILKP